MWVHSMCCVDQCTGVVAVRLHNPQHSMPIAALYAEQSGDVSVLQVTP